MDDPSQASVADRRPSGRRSTAYSNSGRHANSCVNTTERILAAVKLALTDLAGQGSMLHASFVQVLGRLNEIYVDLVRIADDIAFADEDGDGEGHAAAAQRMKAAASSQVGEVYASLMPLLFENFFLSITTAFDKLGGAIEASNVDAVPPTPTSEAEGRAGRPSLAPTQFATQASTTGAELAAAPGFRALSRLTHRWCPRNAIALAFYHSSGVIPDDMVAIKNNRAHPWPFPPRTRFAVVSPTSSGGGESQTSTSGSGRSDWRCVRRLLEQGAWVRLDPAMCVDGAGVPDGVEGSLTYLRNYALGSGTDRVLASHHCIPDHSFEHLSRLYEQQAPGKRRAGFVSRMGFRVQPLSADISGLPSSQARRHLIDRADRSGGRPSEDFARVPRTQQLPVAERTKRSRDAPEAETSLRHVAPRPPQPSPAPDAREAPALTVSASAAGLPDLPGSRVELAADEPDDDLMDIEAFLEAIDGRSPVTCDVASPAPFNEDALAAAAAGITTAAAAAPSSSSVPSPSPGFSRAQVAAGLLRRPGGDKLLLRRGGGAPGGAGTAVSGTGTANSRDAAAIARATAEAARLDQAEDLVARLEETDMEEVIPSPMRGARDHFGRTVESQIVRYQHEPILALAKASKRRPARSVAIGDVSHRVDESALEPVAAVSTSSLATQTAPSANRVVRGREAAQEAARAQEANAFSTFAGRHHDAIFQISASVKDQKAAAKDAIRELGCRLSADAHFDPRATHLLVPGDIIERTEKFLSFRAAGKEIVSVNYVLDSLKFGDGKLLAENSYREPSTTVLPRLHAPFGHWKVVLFALPHITRGIRTILLAGGCQLEDVHTTPFPHDDEWAANVAAGDAWLSSIPWASVTHVLIEVGAPPPDAPPDHAPVANPYVPPSVAGADVISRRLLGREAPLLSTDAEKRIRAAVQQAPKLAFNSLEYLFQILCVPTQDQMLARTTAIRYKSLGDPTD
jgi:hypothetical protein